MSEMLKIVREAQSLRDERLEITNRKAQEKADEELTMKLAKSQSAMVKIQEWLGIGASPFDNREKSRSLADIEVNGIFFRFEMGRSNAWVSKVEGDEKEYRFEFTLRVLEPPNWYDDEGDPKERDRDWYLFPAHHNYQQERTTMLDNDEGRIHNLRVWVADKIDALTEEHARRTKLYQDWAAEQDNNKEELDDKFADLTIGELNAQLSPAPPEPTLEERLGSAISEFIVSVVQETMDEYGNY